MSAALFRGVHELPPVAVEQYKLPSAETELNVYYTILNRPKSTENRLHW